MSLTQYTHDDDFHAIMMYDPWKEKATELRIQLLNTKVDLIQAKVMMKFWHDMYIKLESYYSQR